MSVPEEIVTAADSGQPIRLHTRDGEVLVARVLQFDERELRPAVIGNNLGAGATPDLLSIGRAK